MDAVGELGAGRAEIGAAGTGGIVAGASRGGTRLEIFCAGEILCEQRRAANRAVRVGDEAAVSLGREQHLSAGPDHERIGAAEHRHQDEGEEDGGFEFGEEGFHGWRNIFTTKAQRAQRTKQGGNET